MLFFLSGNASRKGGAGLTSWMCPVMASTSSVSSLLLSSTCKLCLPRQGRGGRKERNEARRSREGEQGRGKRGKRREEGERVPDEKGKRGASSHALLPSICTSLSSETSRVIQLFCCNSLHTQTSYAALSHLLSCSQTSFAFMVRL